MPHESNSGETPSALDAPQPAGAAASAAEPGIVFHVETPAPYQRLAANTPVMVTGWIMLPDGVQAMTVSCGSQSRAARYGLYRPDLALLFPQHADMFHIGFECGLDPIMSCDGETLLNVTALSQTRKHYEITVPLFADSEAGLAVIDPSSEQPAGGEQIRLSVERMSIDPSGLLQVRGWAAGRKRIESIDIFIDEMLIGRADYGHRRDDVAAVWPLWPQSAASGFLFVTDALPLLDTFTLTIQARMVDGHESRKEVRLSQSQRVARRAVTDIHRLQCEAAMLSVGGQMTLSGWALASAGLHKIQVYLGDELLGEASHGHHRPDIGNQFPAVLKAHQSGFVFSGHLNPAHAGDDPIIELETLLSDGTSKRFQVRLDVQRTQSATVSDRNDPICVLDRPAVVNGTAIEPLRGGLEIAGWAVARAGIERITIDVDRVEAGVAYHGMRREDVAAIYPDWPNALLSGFAFSLPRRALKAGGHTVTIRIFTKNLLERELIFNVAVTAGEDQTGPWTLRRKLPAAEQLLIESMQGALKPRPEFLIGLRCQNGDLQKLSETLRSLDEQVYSHWRILLLGVSSKSSVSLMIERDFPAIHKRIVTDKDLSQSKLTRIWFIRIDAGDILAIDALSEFALTIGMNADCDLLYADERKFSHASGQIEAFFKPDWSPHLFTSTNYIGRPWAIPCTSLARLKRKFSDFSTASDYDLLLEYTEAAKHILHIQRVLYERNEEPHEDDLKALQRMVKRRKLKCGVEQGRIEGTYRLRQKQNPGGLVSIIIPTCGKHGYIKACLDSLKRLTAYDKIEIIIIDTIPDETDPLKAWLRAEADVVVEITEAFNWSRFNNLAAAEAQGEYLLFLNDDITIIQPDWLDAILEEAADPTVGVVGPQLLYPDGKVQHAGFFLGEGGKGRHAFRFCDAEDPGYFGLALTRRDVIGVTGACMLMRREVFDTVGGFDEAHAVVNNDLDFCLKAHEIGLSNIYTPFACLIHHELGSRAGLPDEHDERAFNNRWSSRFQTGDPFFHRDLSHTHDIVQYDAEPHRFVFSGHPCYIKRDVERILAVKVDHIGDFVTAFPAFRRIKAHFPKSRLSVLVAPAATHLAHLESAIDEIIPFEFFHTRSGLGQKERDDAALEQLKASLIPLRFDLAIDLRKHPDTRELLRYTGAKVVAGFNAHNAFPWLDIARPFEDDQKLAAKHTHISDDLLGLIDQIALAGELDRDGVRRGTDFETQKQTIVGQFRKEGLFTRPLVCIHPASGTEMRQWPPAFFAALADILVEAENVDIAIIGGADEQRIADLMISSVKHKERIVSLIGRVNLADLPYFLASCGLFVGNNSGPQHLAASLGVPTVGIHSGVVDPAEWGPLGPRALAVRRDMTCAPCYLSKLEDCHRALACLTQLSPSMVLSASRRFLHFY